MAWALSPADLKDIQKDLEQFGDKILSEVEALALEAEADLPVHVPYEPWGRRRDRLRLSGAWRELEALAAREGMIPLGYGKKRLRGRLHQMAKIYLFHPSSAFMTCPLAMTDGAAKLIETLGSDLSAVADKELGRVFDHLMDRRPEEFWTCGQWMTERTGGSDVGAGEALARPTKEAEYFTLHGVKWFSSATSSPVVFTLAKLAPEDRPTLFFLPVKGEDGELLPGIKLLRLKDKLGTKALPTAEMELDGARALLVGEAGKGVRNISHLFNVTRVYNACTSVATWRRLLELAKDYSTKRRAFGKTLGEHPLHKKMLQQSEADLERAFALTFYTALTLGRFEDGEKRYGPLVRLLTPVSKLVSAKRTISAVSELVESFGGAGYVEDTGIPKFLRDAQVFSIWEGTTNVLALDVLRAIDRDQSLSYYLDEMRNLNDGKDQDLERRLGELERDFASWSKERRQEMAREFSFALADITSDAVLGNLK